MTRTHDLLITNQLLYRLSYTSKYSSYFPAIILSRKSCFVNGKIFEMGEIPLPGRGVGHELNFLKEFRKI